MDFLLAVAENNVEKARDFLKSGIDVNSPVLWNTKNTFSPVLPKDIATRPELQEQLQPSQEYYSRPLNLAVLGGHADMVRLLLSAGADINLKDGRGRTALLCAIYGLDVDVTDINPVNQPFVSQTHELHLDILKNILLSHPNIYASTLDAPQYETKGITPLCMASYLGKGDIIQLLLEDGRVNVDGTDSKNATALMYAARDDNVAVVKILLSFNASPDLTDSHGWSAIQYAQGRPAIIQHCEEALRRKRANLTHLHNSKYSAHYTKLSLQISSIPDYPSSLSHLQFNTLKDIDLLDPSAAPLVQIIQTAFMQAIKTHNHNALRSLLLFSPPLHENQRPQSGPILVNAVDPKNGMTALHHAIRAKPIPSLDTIVLLYHAGADINAQTHLSRTALHHLARFGVDKSGKSWGIQKINKGDKKNGGRPAHIDSINSSPMSPVTQTAEQDQENRLSVQSAASSASASSTGTLSNADPFHPNTRHLLAAPTVQQHLALCASLLIRLGALVNIADPAGNTPLHFAAEFGGVPEVIEVLIEGNADLTLKNKKGLTPIDVCRTEEIRKRMLAFEQERKASLKTRSGTSSIGGNIKSLEADTHSLLSRSVSRSTLKSTHDAGKAAGETPEASSKWSKRQNTNGDDDDDAESLLEDAFDKILRAFFSYQTTFTDNIERALGQITETILNNWNTEATEHQQAIVRAQITLAQLRHDLREAHDMFDVTDQRVSRVMLHYREELEQVEQIHQADGEMSDLQADKIDKLFDVYGRIEGRFTQLELDQTELVDQVEQLRKVVVRHIERGKEFCKDSEFWDAVANLTHTLLILGTITIDPNVYSLEDRSRLSHDIGTVIDDVLAEMQLRESSEALTQAQDVLMKNWQEIHAILNKPPENEGHDQLTGDALATEAAPVQPTKTTHWQKQQLTIKYYDKQSQIKDNAPVKTLNELELEFEISQANLYEVQKELDEINQQMAQILTQKRRMYDSCLALESELIQRPLRGGRNETTVRAELEQVMLNTQSLFQQQTAFETRRSELRRELIKIEGQMDETRKALKLVRPPLLLQGLLERLEVDDRIVVRVEKDWKEDVTCVTEVFEEETTDDSSSTSSTSGDISKYLDHLPSKLALQCLLARLDASLYCLKIVARHQISHSRQLLLEIQATLNQASLDLEDIKTRMGMLYDDAAEVAHQVFTLKTELETIVRHRKEEIVKVWEVVNEVSEGIDANTDPQQQALASETSLENRVDAQTSEDLDRHQWIIRELEQLQNVHDNLQEAIEDLQREQKVIGENLRNLANDRLEPQILKLVGQDNASLITISDCLVDLMDRIRHREFGILPSHLSVTPRASQTSMRRLSIGTQNSIQSVQSLSERRPTSSKPHQPDRKHRQSVISTTSFTSLSSYQQERMLARASTLSSAYSKSRSSLKM